MLLPKFTKWGMLKISVYISHCYIFQKYILFLLIKLSDIFVDFKFSFAQKLFYFEPLPGGQAHSPDVDHSFFSMFDPKVNETLVKNMNNLHEQLIHGPTAFADKLPTLPAKIKAFPKAFELDISWLQRIVDLLMSQTQQAFTCPKLTTETLEQDVKYVQS